MKAQAITTIILLVGLACYFGYWGIQYIAFRPFSIECISCMAIAIASIGGIAEQYRNNIKIKKS